jgi:hypothetical protein
MEQSTELSTVNPNEFGIEEKTATELTQGLQVPLDERKLLIEEFETVSKLEINHENIPAFKSLRLKIQKNRTQGIEAWHKSGKEYFLRGGQFVDAIKRKEVLINKQMEEKLKEGEDFFENQELERVAKLQAERVQRISKYVEDAYERDFTRFDEEEFEDLLVIKKKSYEERLAEEARIEAERLEAIRLEAERLEKQRLENIKKKLRRRKRLCKKSELKH